MIYDHRQFEDPRANALLEKCLNIVRPKIESEWWRHYHDMSHLYRMIRVLVALESTIASKYLLNMIAFICFHDVVYDPTKTDNEQQSVEFMYLHEEMVGTRGANVSVVAEAIANSGELIENSAITNKFDFRKFAQRVDCDVIINGTLSEIMAWEEGIFKEYQYVPDAVYVVERTKVLNRLKICFPEAKASLDFLIEYVATRKPKIGLYVGSFDPFHVGHLDIAIKARAIFDKVVIVQGVNLTKAVSQYCISKVDTLRLFHRGISRDSMLDIVKRYEQDYHVTIVRGLRSGLDLVAEFDYAAWLKDMEVLNNIVYLPAANNLVHVSSSSIRALMQIAPGTAMKRMVP